MKPRLGRRSQGSAFRTIAVLVVSLALVFVLVTFARPPSTGNIEPRLSEATATASGVTVDAARADFGRVPLDTEVRHAFRITNTGTQHVRLQQATIEVLEGCCPPTPVVGAASLAPGETTTVSLAMAMHLGMDGRHHFRLRLPVGAGTAPVEPLEMHVFGDFR